MIYSDLEEIRYQKADLSYIRYREPYYFYRRNLPIHIEHDCNIPIGPTMLVEWNEE